MLIIAPPSRPRERIAWGSRPCCSENGNVRFGTLFHIRIYRNNSAAALIEERRSTQCIINVFLCKMNNIHYFRTRCPRLALCIPPPQRVFPLSQWAELTRAQWSLCWRSFQPLSYCSWSLLLLVAFSHSRLSSLCIGDSIGRGLMPWNRRHSGQTWMWVQPLTAKAASCANRWETGSGIVPLHSFPLLRLMVFTSREVSVWLKRVLIKRRFRRDLMLSWHDTILRSSFSISWQTEIWGGKKERDG